MKFWIIALSISVLCYKGYAQELNAKVQVLTPKIQTPNQQKFNTLKKAVRQFLNNRSWTNETYKNTERINCQFVITINKANSNKYEGNLQVLYSRPIYKSDYSSPVLVHRDNNFNFEYIEFDRLEFSPNTSLSNLTSMLAFYAYVIIGLDHDTFSPMGGTKYYQKAQTVVSNAQNNGFNGWGSFNGTKNRYWLADNLNSPAFDNFRGALYAYHRQGLDLMHEQGKHRTAKKNIKNALMGLEKVNEQRRNSYVMQLWFDAKSKEIVNIFSGGEPVPTADLKELLIELNPNNSSNYEKIGKG